MSSKKISFRSWNRRPSTTPETKFSRVAPGEFIQLENGVSTHFKLFLPLFENQKSITILCIGGFTVGHQMFDDFGPFASMLGFQVLTFDPYGRGYSDHVNAQYNDLLYLNQAFLLLRALSSRIYDRLIIASSSNGSHLTAEIVVKLHESKRYRVEKVLFVSPLVPQVVELISSREDDMPSMPPRMALLLSVPVLRWVIFWGMIAYGYFQSMMIEFVRISYNDPNSFLATENVHIVQESMSKHPGFLQAVLSTLCYSECLRNPYHCRQRYQDLGKLLTETGVRCLVIWGTQDAVTPFEYHKPMMEWLGPQAELLVVQGANHGELLSEWEDEYWQVVTRNLQKFLCAEFIPFQCPDNSSLSQSLSSASQDTADPDPILLESVPHSLFSDLRFLGRTVSKRLSFWRKQERSSPSPSPSSFETSPPSEDPPPSHTLSLSGVEDLDFKVSLLIRSYPDPLKHQKSRILDEEDDEEEGNSQSATSESNHSFLLTDLHPSHPHHLRDHDHSQSLENQLSLFQEFYLNDRHLSLSLSASPSPAQLVLSEPSPFPSPPQFFSGTPLEMNRHTLQALVHSFPDSHLILSRYLHDHSFPPPSFDAYPSPSNQLIPSPSPFRNTSSRSSLSHQHQHKPQQQSEQHDTPSPTSTSIPPSPPCHLLSLPPSYSLTFSDVSSLSSEDSYLSDLTDVFSVASGSSRGEGEVAGATDVDLPMLAMLPQEINLFHPPRPHRPPPSEPLEFLSQTSSASHSPSPSPPPSPSPSSSTRQISPFFNSDLSSPVLTETLLIPLSLTPSSPTSSEEAESSPPSLSPTLPQQPSSIFTLPAIHLPLPSPSLLTRPFSKSLSNHRQSTSTLSFSSTSSSSAGSSTPLPSPSSDSPTNLPFTSSFFLPSDPPPSLPSDPLPSPSSNPPPSLPSDPLPSLPSDPLPSPSSDPLPSLPSDPLPSLPSDPPPSQIKNPES